MIGGSFEALYRRLLLAAERYHAVERTPDTVHKLAEAHWELHLARGAIAEERERLTAGGSLYTRADDRWLDELGIQT